MLENIASLQRLHLQTRGFETEEMDRLCTACRGFKGFIALSLSGYLDSDTNVMAILASALLAEGHYMEVLELMDTHMGSNGILALRNALPTLVKLQALNLQGSSSHEDDDDAGDRAIAHLAKISWDTYTTSTEFGPL